MNHDAAHCIDYENSCPKSCYRGQLTKELYEKEYRLPVSWMHLYGTEECSRRGELEDYKDICMQVREKIKKKMALVELEEAKRKIEELQKELNDE